MKWIVDGLSKKSLFFFPPRPKRASDVGCQKTQSLRRETSGKCVFVPMGDEEGHMMRRARRVVGGRRVQVQLRVLIEALFDHNLHARPTKNKKEKSEKGRRRKRKRNNKEL